MIFILAKTKISGRTYFELMSNSNLQTEALLFLTLRSVPGGIQAGKLNNKMAFPFSR